MTMRDVRLHLMKDLELEEVGEMPRTKSGRKALGSRIDRAVNNIMAGRRWDA